MSKKLNLPEIPRFSKDKLEEFRLAGDAMAIGGDSDGLNCVTHRHPCNATWMNEAKKPESS